MAREFQPLGRLITRPLSRGFGPPLPMTYRIFQRDGQFYFQCRSSLAVTHGPFTTRDEAKAAAKAYVSDF